MQARVLDEVAELDAVWPERSTRERFGATLRAERFAGMWRMRKPFVHDEALKCVCERMGIAVPHTSALLRAALAKDPDVLAGFNCRHAPMEVW